MKTTTTKGNKAASVGIVFFAAVVAVLQPLRSAELPSQELGRCGGVILVPTNAPAVIAAVSGDFQIVPTFNTNVTAAQRVVMQRAIDEWNATIQSRGFNPGNYPVSFQYGPLPSPKIGNTTTTYNANNGDLISASVTIDPSYSWFEDPTPADDSEFTGSNPPAGFDLLSVVRHELGHAVGWAGTQRETGLVANNVFDAARLNIALIANDPAHCDPSFHLGELMQPSIGASTRLFIQLYPTAALVARSFHYNIPMHFVDSGATGAQTGTAWEPWQSFQAGIDGHPGVPLLLAPTMFAVTRNQTFSLPHAIFSARGGAVVFAP